VDTMRKNVSKTASENAHATADMKSTVNVIFRECYERQNKFTRDILMDIGYLIDKKDQGSQNFFWESLLTILLAVDEFYQEFNILPVSNEKGTWMLNKLLVAAKEKYIKMDAFFDHHNKQLHQKNKEQHKKCLLAALSCRLALGSLMQRLPSHIAKKIHVPENFPRTEKSSSNSSPKPKVASEPGATPPATAELKTQINPHSTSKKVRSSAQKIASKQKKKEKKKKKQLAKNRTAIPISGANPPAPQEKLLQNENPMQQPNSVPILPASNATSQVMEALEEIKRESFAASCPETDVAFLSTDQAQTSSENKHENEAETLPLQEQTPEFILKTQMIETRPVKLEVKSKYTAEEIAERKALKKARRLGQILVERPSTEEKKGEQEGLLTTVVPQEHTDEQALEFKQSITAEAKDATNFTLVDENMQVFAHLSDLHAKDFFLTTKHIITWFDFLEEQNKSLLDLYLLSFVKPDISNKYSALLREGNLFMRRIFLRIKYGSNALLPSPVPLETLKYTFLQNAKMHSCLKNICENDALMQSYKILQENYSTLLTRITKDFSAFFVKVGQWYSTPPLTCAQPAPPSEQMQVRNPMPVPVARPASPQPYLRGSLAAGMWGAKVSNQEQPDPQSLVSSCYRRGVHPG